MAPAILGRRYRELLFSYCNTTLSARDTLPMRTQRGFFDQIGRAIRLGVRAGF